MKRLTFPREFFLSSLSGIYAIAFASIKSQIPGLYGVDGLEPVHIFLQNLQQNHPPLQSDSFINRFLYYPTLVWLSETWQWPVELFMDGICLIGMTLALLSMILPGYRTIVSLALIWLCYFSITQVGQTFMRFQWDSFLLEIGFLAIFLAPPWRSTVFFEAPAGIVWTLRFLFFKFIFMSGCVKIQSRCPTWLGLTALEYHYATQPLPLPLSWYAHQLPPIVHRLSVAATLLIEGPLAFLLLAPSRVLRQFGAGVQLLLQVLIMCSGNYNFFNLLTSLMAMALIDIENESIVINSAGDLPKSIRTFPAPSSLKNWGTAPWDAVSVFRGWVTAPWDAVSVFRGWVAAPWSISTLRGWGTAPWGISNVKGWVITIDSESIWYNFNTNPWVNRLLVLFSVVYTIFSAHEIFSISSISSVDNSFMAFLLSLSISFVPTVDEVQAWIGRVLSRCVVFSAVLLTVASSWQLLRYLCVFPNSSSRKWGIFYLVFTMVISIVTFSASVVTISTLDPKFQQKLPSFVLFSYQNTVKYQITSAYGLFRTMTGVGTVSIGNKSVINIVARPELIIEGTDDHGLTWKEYEFQYKPGDIYKKPRLAAPFQPRLDWQMWFAALGEYHQAAWIVHLVSKLLVNSKAVKDLLDTARDPFPNAPPHAIRVQLYYYDYTRYNTTWQQQLPMVRYVENDGEEVWWHRIMAGKEYLPPLEKENPSLKAFLHAHNWGETEINKGRKRCNAALDSTRGLCEVVEQLQPYHYSSVVLVVAVLMARWCSGKLVKKSWFYQDTKKKRI